MSSTPFDHSSQLSYTEAPNPGWQFGDKVDSTPEGEKWVEAGKAGFTTFRTSEEDPIFLYKLLVSGVVPRPIAFVSTVSLSGMENLAPFSWFTSVSSDPPVIAFGVTDPFNPGRLKDTVLNIKEMKGFTVNIISIPFAHNALACAVDAPSDVSEWALSGLTKEPSTFVKAARVKESAFSLECELTQTVDIVHPDTGVTTTTLVLGLVKCAHARNDVLTPKRTIDPAHLQALGALGDISYARIGDAFRVPRFNWNADGERIVEFLQAGQAQASGGPPSGL